MKLVLWIARGLGTSLILLVLVFLIGEGVPPLFNSSISESVGHLALLLMLMGVVAAWKWEGLGSSVILMGFGLFWINNYVASGNWRIGWVFLMFAVTGFLFALHWQQAKSKHKSP